MIALISVAIILFFTYFYYKREPFGINFFFNLGCLFYFIPNIFNILYGDNQLRITEIAAQQYFASILIFVLTWNFFSIFFKTSSYKLPSLKIAEDTKLIYLLFYGSMTVFILGFIGSIGLEVYLGLNRALFYQLKEGLPAYLEIFLNFATVFFFIILSKKIAKNQNYLSFAFIFVFATFVILIPTGARGKLIAIIFGILFLLAINKKIEGHKIIFPGIILGTFFQLWGKVRHLANDPGQIISFLQRKLSWDTFDISKGESQANLNAFNKIFNNGWPISYKDNYASVIESFELLIPSFIYQRNFSGLSSWFVQSFYTDVYLVGGGKAFSILAEGYMYDGLLGVFFISLLVWLSFTFLSVFVRYVLGKQYIMIFHASLLFDVFQLPRIFYGSFLKQMVIMVLVPIFTLVILNYVFKKR